MGMDMSYIKEILTEGEKIVYSARVHWIAFWTPVSYLLLGVFFFFDGMGWMIRSFGLRGLNRNLGFTKIVHDIEAATGFGAHQIVAASFFVLFVIYLYLRIVRYFTTEIGMTNRRVVVKVGWMRIDSVEILLDKVESIMLHQSNLGRLLNFGSLAFVSGSLGGTSIRWVSKPRAFHKAVQNQISSPDSDDKECPPESGSEPPETDV